MIIKEYQKKVVALQQRLVGCPVATQVEESLCVDNVTVTIKLGRESGISFGDDEYTLDSHWWTYGQYKELFKKNAEDFDTVLEMLTSRVDEVVDASTELLAIIADQDIPELVLDRMAGMQIGKEPAELMMTIASRKLKQLYEKLMASSSPFDDVTKTVKLAGKELSLRKGDTYKTDISWSDFGNVNHRGEYVGGTPQALAIIANYPRLEKAVDRFIAMLEKAGK